MPRHRRRKLTAHALGALAVLALLAPGTACAQGKPDEARAAAFKERDRLWTEAQKLRDEGKTADAVVAAEAMLAIERKILPEGDADLAVSLDWLAQVHTERDDFAAATAARRQALEVLRVGRAEDDWRVVDARLALAYAERLAGMDRTQRARLKEAERLSVAAVKLHRAGKYGEATTAARQALAISIDILGEHHPDTGAGLCNLATFLKAQGDYAAAGPLFERALAIQKGALGERHPETADTLNNLAELLRAQGDYAAARPLYERSLAVRKAVLGGNHPNTAIGLNNLALLLAAQGDYAGARPLYEQALAILKASRGERHPDVAVGMNNLAELLRAQGDHAGARPLYEQALAILKDSLGERHPANAMILNNLASMLESQGDHAGARPLYERGLVILKDSLGERHPDTATGMNNLAASLKGQGDYAAARPLLEQALATQKAVLGERHPETANTLNNLAELMRAQGDDAGARPLFERSLAIMKAVLGERHPSTANTVNNLAFLLEAQGEIAAARPYFEQAVEIVRGNLDLAADALTERQQLAMTDKLRFNLDVFLSAAPRVGIGDAEAYDQVFAWKGAVMERQRRLRVLRRALAADPRPEVARDAARWQGLVGQLATRALATPPPGQADAWRAKVVELTAEKDRVEAELTRQSAEFRKGRAEARRTPAQLQAALTPGSVLIDFLEYDHSSSPPGRKGPLRFEWRLLAFVVRPGAPVVRVELGPLAPIHKAVAAWRAVLADPKGGAGDAPGATLKTLVWDPLAAKIEGATTVLVSPDGPLALVPPAALPGKAPGSFLVEEVTIAVVPVPRLFGLNGAEDSKPAAPSLLLVGDVDYGQDPGAASVPGDRRSAAVDTRDGLFPTFPKLKSTGDEIAAIGRYFGQRFRGAVSDELSGELSTEEALRQGAPTHRYLHLATHGYFAAATVRSALDRGPDDKAKAQGLDPLGGAGVSGYHPGLLSGLALTGANVRPTPDGKDDGILTALEVAELDLGNVDLAVLSACETGLGRVAGGEGLLGLQRAFQVAGARAVVASLWSVGDEPTRSLMSRFYEELWRKKKSPLDALRAAQLEMLRGGLFQRKVGGVNPDGQGFAGHIDG